MNKSPDPEKIRSPKYWQLMRTAEELFMQFGVKRVTVQEICETAQVSKMTFYKYFRNKEDLAKQVIVALFDEGQTAFDEIMSREITFSEKMGLFVRLKLDYGERFSKEFYSDFLGLTPEIRELIAERSQKGRDQMLEILREAQQKGKIREDLNLEFLSFMLDHFFELSEDPRLLSIFPTTYELARDWLDFFLYGIMGRAEVRNE